MDRNFGKCTKAMDREKARAVWKKASEKLAPYGYVMREKCHFYSPKNSKNIVLVFTGMSELELNALNSRRAS